jgi:hypothetical protein
LFISIYLVSKQEDFSIGVQAARRASPQLKRWFWSPADVGIAVFKYWMMSPMGIDLRWENENGERLAELIDKDSVVESFLPQTDAQDFPCLSFVDPYGDTIFNQQQIVQAVSELERLSAQKHEPKAEHHLLAVLEFVRQAAGAVHTYIRFYGD